MLLLWVSLFPVTWENVNNRHFMKESIKRKKIHRSDEAMKIAKASIERMVFEYEDRKKYHQKK